MDRDTINHAAISMMLMSPNQEIYVWAKTIRHLCPSHICIIWSSYKIIFHLGHFSMLNHEFISHKLSCDRKSNHGWGEKKKNSSRAYFYLFIFLLLFLLFFFFFFFFDNQVELIGVVCLYFRTPFHLPCVCVCLFLKKKKKKVKIVEGWPIYYSSCPHAPNLLGLSHLIL